MVKVEVDGEPIPGTLGVMQENTLDGLQGNHTRAFTLHWGLSHGIMSTHVQTPIHT